MTCPHKTEDGRTPRISAPDSQFATVLVGKGKHQKRFVVHEQLLTRYSEFFRAALTGGFEEAKDKTVKLEDDEPQLFEFFVHWLYYQRFPDCGRAADEELEKAWIRKEDDDIAGDGLGKTGVLICFYVFSSKYRVDKLTAEVLDELFHHLHEPDHGLPYPEDINFAFNNLSEGSRLCRLLIDAQSHWSAPDAWAADHESLMLSSAFLFGVMRRYAEIAQRDRLLPIDGDLELCDYHEHTSREEREACLEKQEERECEERE